jgi:MFS family permease
MLNDTVASRFATATPFGRLAIAHAASICGDAILTVSLAGSLFFSVSPGESRPKVLLYLALTMAPFAVVAPLLGPLLDKTRGGRRMMVFVTCAARAVLCVFMAGYIDEPATKGGLLVYPLAFGVLVMSKTYAVAKSAIVPSVVDGKDTLVKANSRLAVISVVGGAVGALPAAGIYKLFGAPWSLLLATVVFAVAAVLALQIPRPAPADRIAHPLEREELHSPSILLAGSAMGVLRGAVGFATFFLAFALRHAHEPAWFFGLVIAASAAGGFLGNVVTPPLRRITREEFILTGSLLLPAVACLFMARSGAGISLLIAGLVVATGAASGRIAFDSLVQRDAPDAVRGRSFARFETRFQLSFVIGALIPVAITPLFNDPRIGLFVLAVTLGFSGLSYVGGMRAAEATLERRRRRAEQTREAVRRGASRLLARVRGSSARERSKADTERPRQPAATRGEPPEAFPGGG